MSLDWVTSKELMLVIFALAGCLASGFLDLTRGVLLIEAFLWQQLLLPSQTLLVLLGMSLRGSSSGSIPALWLTCC